MTDLTFCLAFCLPPFLNMWITSAVYQSAGILPEFNELGKVQPLTVLSLQPLPLKILYAIQLHRVLLLST